MNLDEYLDKRGITPESRARIDAHKKRMMLLLEHTSLPQIRTYQQCEECDTEDEPHNT